MKIAYTVSSLEELQELTKELIPKFENKKIIGISGELGAGKTTFVQAVCKRLGVAESVNSPTYSLENRYSYQDGKVIYHLDLFRLDGYSNVEFIDELIDRADGLVFIEWPERFAQVLEKVQIFIVISIEENGSRTIEFLQK